MPSVWIIAIVVVVAAVIGISRVARNSSNRQGSPDRDTASASRKVSRSAFPQPAVTDFHVKGAVASTMFAVPLGDAPAGTHLVEILSAAAVEYIRRKAAEGLPLGGIASIDVYAMRGADRERVGTVELPKVGVLPEPLSVSIAPLGDVDPIAAVAGVVADAGVKAPSGSEGGLESVASFIQLTGPNEARLRSIGVDPASMSLQELVVGLMQAGGYDVHPAPTTFHSAGLSEADTYRASLAGRTSTIVVLTHNEGDYPEVEEIQLAELAVAASQVRTDQLVLVTDKYGPYSMYDRERRTDKLVFVTRERLQSFVDSFGLG